MRRNLDALAGTHHDLLVVGAGVYGICAAWDAAQRGLKVALVDRGDFLGATSCNSLRIVHGGLRYLQQADLPRMRQSIRERRTLLRIAPHLVRPLSCVMPSRRSLLRRRSVLGCALLLNDLVSWDRNRGVDGSRRLPPGRTLSRAECLDAIPGLDPADVTGGALWYDAQMLNSERLGLGYLHLAVGAGVDAANYFRVDGLLEAGGRIQGVRGTDLLTGTAREVRAQCVLNAAGPWVRDVLGPPRAGALPSFRLSRTMNLVVRRRLVRDHAFAVGEGAGRLLFLVPWNGATLVGTTHLPHAGDPDAFRVKAEDIAWFVAEVNRAYPAAQLAVDEVATYHAGLLPSTGVDARGEAVLLRHPLLVDHSRTGGPRGLLTVLGVKWTTSRAVAERSVDLVFRMLGRRPPPCRTATTPLPGSGPAVPETREGLPEDAAALLARDYGDAQATVLAAWEEAPGVLPGPVPVLRAQVLHAVREEMAVHLDDVVFRRTALGSLGDPGEGLDACSRLAAGELGWNEDRRRAEIGRVRARFLPAD